MILIRTADHLARVLASSLDPPLRSILEGHRDRLAEYTDFAFEELANFVICQPGDTAADLEVTLGRSIPPWEYVLRQADWIEAVAASS